jgi:hypothetical protein
MPEGAALLHRSDAAGSLDAGPLRVLLLTCDAAIAAEMQASCASVAGTTAALEADVYALGLALRPGCPPAAAARAAAAALVRGWRAAARRVLRALAQAGLARRTCCSPAGSPCCMLRRRPAQHGRFEPCLTRARLLRLAHGHSWPGCFAARSATRPGCSARRCSAAAATPTQRPCTLLLLRWHWPCPLLALALHSMMRWRLWKRWR